MKPMHPRKRLAWIIRELHQLIVDKEWWNQNRTEHPPFDVGYERVQLKLARKAARLYDAGRVDEAKVVMQAMEEHCNTRAQG